MSVPRFDLVSATSLVCLLVAGLQRVEAQDAASANPRAAAQPAASPGEELFADELTEEARRTLDSLRATLPGDSEARLMLEDIVQGHRLGPGDGWFRVAVAQSRYDWSTVAARYDRNSDGAIQREEFPGSDADFRSLDRDRNSLVTAEDLAWQDHSLVRSPGALLFRQADQDSNGKVTPAEFSRLFQQLDSDSTGYLSLDDLREHFRQPADSAPDKGADRPNRSTLILGLARQEIGSLQPGPAVGDKAPDFTLASLDGAPVTLSAQIGPQPVVLIFGNFTCGPFRSHAGNLEKLYQRYQQRARFFLVYVREAHPRDGWASAGNQQVGIDPAQPTSDEQRCEIAGECRKHLQLEIPLLVDTISDTVGTNYSGMPNRFYLIDREGRVAFKSGRGPFGFKPGELEQALVWNLAEQQGVDQTASADTSSGEQGLR